MTTLTPSTIKVLEVEIKTVQIAITKALGETIVKADFPRPIRT